MPCMGVMSLHKLTAGGGYDYLTRQVAAHDTTEKGHTGLASYYTERGETPGQWIGSGMDRLDGLDAGDVVTAEQMQALFGAGYHPLATERREALAGPDLTARDYDQITRLGQPFVVHDNDVSAFRVEVARRFGDYNESLGFPRDWAIPVQERARIRTEVGIQFFRQEHSRAPEDARELAASIAKHSRPKTTAVAGFDLTFSPVKSVSTLWALADPALASRVERAHQAAIKDALDFIETHALFSRTGKGGVQQINVQGLVATAFTHRDSRAGDPDLHTHVAVANKVQTADGRWLSIDGRLLYKAAVTASETYNTALEKHLTRDLGVQFAERANPDPRKRPVREIVGIEPALNERWSARRVSIQARRADLARDFQATHGRPPTPIESIKLAQQATLETRDAKKEPRTLAEQRLLWRGQARQVLGSDEAIGSMIAAATRGNAPRSSPVVNRAWVRTTAAQIRDAVQSNRSTWQSWHVRAEALRRVRGIGDVPANEVDAVVSRLVDEVLRRHCVRVTQDHDPVREPRQLTRKDGVSVYRVHGADHYTSTAILNAEQRIVAAAGRQNGWSIEPRHVDLALLESTANGVTLNAGQASLVREMATSTGSVQLAIAPAGAGKTTAMRALSNAWHSGGGTVLGIAPSAAAAAVLGDQINVATDTMAKLVWSLNNDPNNLPDWARAVDQKTLLIVDEAGMADTLSLDTVVTFALARGAKVRLIGDDQQLAAIGAGGVLRDVEATHGALRLNELMRFTTPGEGAASLALRDGDHEALGFYLDRGRVHVGDQATMAEEVFESWRSDRDASRESIMLAPTRDLVAQLNERARTHRLEGAEPGPSVRLSDGLEASVGDRVITRTNDRRLRVSPTDWVKNGDRWTVLDVHDTGALTIQHTRHQQVVTLPADYVAQSTELGYATTVHGAQGVSVDASHALVTDQVSRQSLYTALTRGAAENHIYLEVVGDGDEHGVIRPETLHPATATDLLEGILRRDDSPISATTQSRLDADPTALLASATARYTDALHHAAEELMGPAATSLSSDADAVIPGISDQPAWPALRAHLVLLAAHGQDPVDALTRAATEQELDDARDVAAVLDWRLDDSGHRNTNPGPLPWLPGIPHVLTEHPTWGPYLSARAELVADTALQVRDTCENSPTWARDIGSPPSPETVADVQVWRAARGIEPHDLRPTGPTVLQKAAFEWQRKLDTRVAGSSQAALDQWGDLLRDHVGHDPRFLPVLASRMAAISRAGVDAPAVLRRALAEGHLPDDHAASALWWRINGHLSPAVAAAVATDHELRATWQERLPDLLGATQSEAVQDSPMWPHLVTAIDHGLQAGWTLETLLDTTHLDVPDADLAHALTWRISALTDPPPVDPGHHTPDPFDEPPADLWHGAPVETEHAHCPRDEQGQPHHQDVPDPLDEPPFDLWEDAPAEPVDARDALSAALGEEEVETGIALAAMHRALVSPTELSDADIEQQLRWAVEADASPVPLERLAQVNAMTWQFFQTQLPHGWVPDHLTDRFGPDAVHVDAGYAPDAWTALVDHLRNHGVTDLEMDTAGVATRARTGSLIDRFRDRAVFPIEHNGEILGFVGRRHPDATEDDRKGPKYLNTPDTPLFHKGAQLYVADPGLLHTGATPVLVEGPMDAIAVTLAGQSRYVGVAPLGTALTASQAAQLARLGEHPVVATDADLAGKVAAERAHWMLTEHQLTPTTVTLPEDSDPAELLRFHGREALTERLHNATPLGSVLIEERLTNLHPTAALNAAAQVLAANHPNAWEPGLTALTDRLRISTQEARRTFYTHLTDWDRDPATAASTRLAEVADVKQRLEQAEDAPPTQRWEALAQSIDARLTEQSDWPALANMLDHAAAQGHDVHAAAHAIVSGDDPLGLHPAQDLRYRLAAHLPERPATQSATPTPSRGASLARRRGTPDRPPAGPRR